MFFFGDYQGTRSTVGGSRLLTVPTKAARSGDLSAYGVNIFDPATGPPAQRQQFAGNVIPPGRLSPQAQAILKLIPEPNAPGRENGTRDNIIESGSEAFRENSFNVRIDGRIRDGVNTFGRYSMGKFFRDGPTSFGTGGGQELVSLGGVSDVKNQSLAYGVDYTLSPSMLADFRFGWFRYKVNVLPFDFGTTPATDAGIPNLNVDTTFSSGLPAGFVEGDRGFNFGSGLGVNRCNCPLDQDEKQWQLVGNITKTAGNHNFKAGLDIRRANNLRVPSDAHRSGELSFSVDRTRGPQGGGLGLATFLLGDVTKLRRYVSPNTDAREQQWRTAYYAQDTWRPQSKLTLNYGLRLDIINPQTVNEAGNGGYLDLGTGEIRVAGVGGIGLNGDIKNRLNWAPRVGATYQIDGKTVLRGGFGRSYDLGVFGSLFGHSVTQNLPVLSVQEINAPENFERVFTLAQGPPPPVFPAVPSNGRFRLPDGVFARALPEKQRPPTVDAFNITVQRQLTNTMSVEAAYVGNRGRNVFAGDGPAFNINQPTLVGYPNVSQNNRRPFFAGGVTNNLGLGGAFGWTQGIDYFCNCAKNVYDSLQMKFNKQFSAGYSVKTNYTLQREVQESGDYFIYDRELNKGPADWDRKHSFVLSVVAELPVGRGRKYMSSISPAADAVRWRMAVQHEHHHPERPSVQRQLQGRWSGSRCGRQQPAEPHRRSRGAANAGTMVQRGADRIGWQRLLAPRGRNFRHDETQLAAWAGVLENRRVGVQAHPAERRETPRDPGRGGQPVRQREPGQPGLRSRRARQQQHQRRPDQFYGVLQCRSTAQFPVRAAVYVLTPDLAARGSRLPAPDPGSRLAIASRGSLIASDYTARKDGDGQRLKHLPEKNPGILARACRMDLRAGHDVAKHAIAKSRR